MILLGMVSKVLLIIGVICKDWKGARTPHNLEDVGNTKKKKEKGGTKGKRISIVIIMIIYSIKEEGNGVRTIIQRILGKWNEIEK